MDNEEKNILDQITPVTIVENLPIRSQDLNMIYNTPYKYNIMNLNYLSSYNYIAPYAPLARSGNTYIIIDYICNNINDITHYFINALCGEIVRGSQNSSISEETQEYMMSLFSTVSSFDQICNIYDRLNKCISTDIERLFNYVYELDEMDRREELSVAMNILKPKIFSAVLSIIDEWIMYYVNSATEIMYHENLEGVKINIRKLYAVLYEYCHDILIDPNTIDCSMPDQYQFSACVIRELLSNYQKDIIFAIDGVIATALNMILFNQKPDSDNINIIDTKEDEDEQNIIEVELEG